MNQKPPLAVDLDKTLFLTDTLAEGLIRILFRKPWHLLTLLAAIFQGRPAFKETVFKIAELEIDGLPQRSELIAYLRVEKESGREIVLATGATQAIAERVKDMHGDIFSAAYGSHDAVNLKGKTKGDFLAQAFPSGFVYAGDNRSDLDVWARASGMILAGVSASTRTAALRLGKPVEAEFQNTASGLRAWFRTLRVHHWAKNLLIFVALLLSGALTQPAAWMQSIWAFIVFGTLASATYIINDLADLEFDRHHGTKRHRAFAAGDLDPGAGLALSTAMIIASITAGSTISPGFAWGLVGYLALTLAYTFYLKRVVLLDVVVLACVFTMRIVLGALAIGVPVSDWLMTFSLFFFLSLSLTKRYVEVASPEFEEELAGRGYRSGDEALVQGFGISSGVAAVLIMVLYLAEDAFPSGQYTFPDALWFVPALITLWIMRIWTLAHRGELHEDPVAFAIRDRISLLLGAGLVASFCAAITI